MPFIITGYPPACLHHSLYAIKNSPSESEREFFLSHRFRKSGRSRAGAEEEGKGRGEEEEERSGKGEARHGAEIGRRQEEAVREIRRFRRGGGDHGLARHTDESRENAQQEDDRPGGERGASRGEEEQVAGAVRAGSTAFHRPERSE